MNKCISCKSTNIILIDEEVLITKKTAGETKTIFVKYGRCKSCGFMNLTDAKTKHFQDIINEFWLKNKKTRACCKK